MATSNRWLIKNGLKVGHLNACHLLNKLHDVHSMLSNADDHFHVFGFSETRFKDIVADSTVTISGYKFVRKDVRYISETGIIAYIHQSVNFQHITLFDKHDIECIWLEIKLKKTKPILIGFLYRNPDERANWFDRFELMMEEVTMYSNEIILLGDFNIDLLKSQNKWQSIYESFNLTQILTTPTRVTADSTTLIDHIYVSNVKNIVESSIPVFGLSDHFPICATWSKKGVKIPKCMHKSISYRSYKNFNEGDFMNELCSTDFSETYQHTEPDASLDAWYNVFLNVLNKHAPIRIKRVKFEDKPPWLTDEINSASSSRDRLLQQSGKDHNFKRQRNKVTSMKRLAQKKYFNDLIKSRSDSKSIWKALNQLSGKSGGASTFNNLSVHELNNHFTTIVEKIVDIDITNHNDLSKLKAFCESKSLHSSLNFDYMCVHDVYRELCSLSPAKSRGLDDLDSYVLKIAAPIISEHLTYIYNLCIDKCQYPQAFKDA